MQRLLDSYVNHLKLERSISPLTVRNYARDVGGFLDFLGTQGIESPAMVTRSTLRHYLGWLHERGIVRASISRKLSALRSFYRYLARENLVAVEPLSTLSAPKVERRLPTFLTSEEIQQLLCAPVNTTPQGLRDRAILELLYASGLRVSEVISLDLKDVDLGTREILVWGKGSKERVGLMGVPAAEALDLYLRHSRVKLEGQADTRAVFLNRFGERISERSVQLLIKKHARKAGLDLRVFPHIMRHTFATHLLDGGADLRVVQDLMGHASLASTQIYTHVSQSQMRRSYLAAHPRSSAQKEGDE